MVGFLTFPFAMIRSEEADISFTGSVLEEAAQLHASITVLDNFFTGRLLEPADLAQSSVGVSNQVSGAIADSPDMLDSVVAATEVPVSGAIADSPDMLDSLFTGAYHSDTSDYINRIGVAGSTISTAHAIAVNDFVEGIYADGLRSKIIECGVFAGDDLSSALVKLWHRTGGASSLTNINFVSGDYTAAGGLNPGDNNSTKYLSTSESPVSLGLSPSDTHISFYSLADGTAPDRQREIGTVGVDSFQMIIGYLNDFSFYRSFGFGSAIESATNNNSEAGYYLGSTGTGESYMAYDGVSYASNTLSGNGTAATETISVFRAFNEYSSKPATLYTIGNFLTTSEAADLNSRAQALKTALGR